MDKIKSFLEENTDNSARMFFLERTKNYRTKLVTYNILDVRIDSDLTNEISNAALSQVTEKLAKNPEFREYGVLTGSDRSYIETISRTEVPFLDEILNQLNSRLDLFVYDENKKIHGYIIRLENNNKTLFLFRKYDPQRILKRTILSRAALQGRYGTHDGNYLLFDGNFDAMMFLDSDGTENNASTDSENSETVFILNRRNFEFLFSFTEYYESEVENSQETIENKEIIGNTSLLIDFCKKNSNMARKLVRIIKGDLYQNMTKTSIKQVVNNYDLGDISFDTDEQMIVTKENAWTVLKILDDDYLESENTSNKYEAHSKVKK